MVERFGYKPVIVPAGTLVERADFVLQRALLAPSWPPRRFTT